MNTTSLRPARSCRLVLPVAIHAAYLFACSAPQDTADTSSANVRGHCPPSGGDASFPDGAGTPDGGLAVDAGQGDGGGAPDADGAQGDALAFDAGRSSGVYGAPWTTDSLQNWDIGGPNSTQPSYRFRAPRTGAVKSLHLYLIDNGVNRGGHTGYASGTGGIVRAAIYADDGTSTHAPTGLPLSGQLVDHAPNLVDGDYQGTSAQAFPDLTFASAIPVVAGGIYHVVLTNVDPDPVDNYIGLDGLTDGPLPSASVPVAQISPGQPSASDWGVLLNQGSGWTDWTVVTDGSQNVFNTPSLAITYDDGFAFGCGYMEIWRYTSPRPITGRQEVRESFQPSRDLTVTAVSVRLNRSAGDLAASLECDGSVLQAATIAGSAFGAALAINGYTWVRAPFVLPQPLRSGALCHLVLSAGPNGSFTIDPIRDGSGSYGYPAASTFSDGWAQYSDDGATWNDWLDESAQPSKEGNLPFYFETE